jgi:coenzyme F420-0:L-glutamate ligase/coenzyme F420-1:gamma-L-glutamate ligase
MTTNLEAFLRTRRSIRRFKPEPPPENVLRRIIDTTTYAPSAHNKQPWRFIVLTSIGSKSRLAKAIVKKFRRDMLLAGASKSDIETRITRTLRRSNEAPVIIVLCRDTSESNPQPDTAQKQAETTMDIQSVALAGLQLLLAAHAEGLGGTWICWPLFAPDETRKALELPYEWEPQGMVFLGYSDETPALPERKPLSEIVRYLK